MQRGVQAAGPLLDRARTRGLGDAKHLGIGGHDEDLRHAAGGEGGGDGPAEQPLDEVVPLLSVQDGAQPRLRALERADGDRDGRGAGIGGLGQVHVTMLANVSWRWPPAPRPRGGLATRRRA